MKNIPKHSLPILIPAAVYLAGDLIHLWNLYKIIMGDMAGTLWIYWVNISMFAIDTAVIAGLFLKIRWVYIFGAGFLAVFALSQTISLLVIRGLPAASFIITVASIIVCVAVSWYMMRRIAEKMADGVVDCY